MGCMSQQSRHLTTVLLITLGSVRLKDILKVFSKCITSTSPYLPYNTVVGFRLLEETFLRHDFEKPLSSFLINCIVDQILFESVFRRQTNDDDRDCVCLIATTASRRAVATHGYFTLSPECYDLVFRGAERTQLIGADAGRMVDGEWCWCTA